MAMLLALQIVDVGQMWECNRLGLVPVWGTDLSEVRGS